MTTECRISQSYITNTLCKKTQDTREDFSILIGIKYTYVLEPNSNVSSAKLTTSHVSSSLRF